ncbi:MAG: GspMb/PilO family protein [Syntrophobacteraceae bacterium]
MKLGLPKLADLKKYRMTIAAFAVVLLALVAIDLLWLDPVIGQNELLEAKVKQQRELILKYEQKLNQTESIRENLAKQEQELKEMQTRLFRGTDPYQLAASLGDLLSSKVGDGRKLEIKTYQVLASKEFGLYQEVHLRFNIMTTVEGLFYFLDRVKNSEFAILVHEINIQKIQRNKGPDLVVNVILAALMEKGEKT